jgi:hypothetical protein
MFAEFCAYLINYKTKNIIKLIFEYYILNLDSAIPHATSDDIECGMWGDV